MNPPVDIRWQQRLVNFERALSLLREAMANGPEALNQLEKEGVIQRFEYCFELAWKTTRDYMESNGFIDNPIVFEQAVEAIQQRYLQGLEQLHRLLQKEVQR